MEQPSTLDDLPLTLIERAVTQWPGVAIGNTGSDGLQFNYGCKVRDKLIAQGRAAAHDPLPDSG